MISAAPAQGRRALIEERAQVAMYVYIYIYIYIYRERERCYIILYVFIFIYIYIHIHTYILIEERAQVARRESGNPGARPLGSVPELAFRHSVSRCKTLILKFSGRRLTLVCRCWVSPE